MKKRLATATAPEIEKRFDKVLESVQAEAKRAEEEAETTLESEIDKIVDSEDQLQEGEGCGKLKEDDLLRGRVHNGHLDEAEGDEENSEEDDSEEEETEEDFETTEEVNVDANGDVNLEESEVIDPNLMKMWCAQSLEVY